MTKFATKADIEAINAEQDWHDRGLPKTMYEFTKSVKERHGSRSAVSFQIFSGPKDHAETLNWAQFHDQSVQTANLLRGLGVGETDAVAYMLPCCNEACLTLVGGAMAGIANPVNPLLDAEQIAAILRETNAKVLVTL